MSLFAWLTATRDSDTYRWKKAFGEAEALLELGNQCIRELNAENARLARRVDEVTRQNEDLRQQIDRAVGPRVAEIASPARPVGELLDVGTGVGAFGIAVVGESKRQVALQEFGGDRGGVECATPRAWLDGGH